MPPAGHARRGRLAPHSASSAALPGLSSRTIPCHLRLQSGSFKLRPLPGLRPTRRPCLGDASQPSTRAHQRPRVPGAPALRRMASGSVRVAPRCISASPGEGPGREWSRRRWRAAASPADPPTASPAGDSGCAGEREGLRREARQRGRASTRTRTWRGTSARSRPGRATWVRAWTLGVPTSGQRSPSSSAARLSSGTSTRRASSASAGWRRAAGRCSTMRGRRTCTSSSAPTARSASCTSGGSGATRRSTASGTRRGATSGGLSGRPWP
mmetsp:Transcript_36967/g.104287  ORF Transcript_36967/g.104287 Transcript_36967/m.104287 type:complete len:269 (-) Transcript_36967:587-1393(-)